MQTLILHSSFFTLYFSFTLSFSYGKDNNISRLFGNKTTACIENGKLEENGCGKFCDFTPAVLKRIKEMGITHVWYTGVVRHATATDYSKYGIP